MNSLPLIRFDNISKVYAGPVEPVVIFQDFSWSLPPQSSVAIIGESGTGKSTLLHLAGCIDKPSSGKIYFDDKDLSELNDSALALFRAKTVGMVFQFHFLLKEFNAWENVWLPAWLAGTSRNIAKDYARHLLADVGLDHRYLHFPGQLSGGERQRVAIARALINNPSLILADEPTGNLDDKHSRAIQDLLLELVEIKQKALILVTHDENFALRTNKVFRLARGMLKSL